MLKLIQYPNGECRVVDDETLLASQFLNHHEMAAPLTDYELDCEIDRSEIDDEPHTVLRSEANKN